jgi:hypothetical protein
MEQLSYIGAEGEIRLVDADATDDGVFVREPCDNSPFANAFRLAWSPGGTHLGYICTDPNVNNHALVVVDSSGEEVQRLPASRFKWSPDGEKIALEAERVAVDRGSVVEVLDVSTGGTVRLADDGLVLQWVGGASLLVGLTPEFSDVGVRFGAHLADVVTGDSEPLPRFDNVLNFWVGPEGARAIVLTEWSIEHSSTGMAVLDFATGQETEISRGYISYGSDHIPERLLAFSKDGSTIYWGNPTDVSDVPFWRASVLADAPVAVELARLPGFGSVSPGGRVAYFGLERDNGGLAFLVADLLTGTTVGVPVPPSKAEVAWRTLPDGVPSTRVSGDDRRVVEAVLRAGFAEFAGEFERAVEANDVEFIFQLAHYGEFECRGGFGLPAPPTSCLLQPVGLLVPAIQYGIWNSEGGYYSPEQYAEFVLEKLEAKAAPDVHVYAIGHHIRGADEDDGGVDIVVGDVGGSSAPGAAIVFRAASVGGDWKIVGVKIARVDQVDWFFDWWTPWEKAFPAGPTVAR